jgi:hypothetical protein
MSAARDEAHDRRPGKGAFVVDLRRGRLGQVMGHEGPSLQLRPPRGGVEWDACPEDTRPATDTERLTAKVQAANAESKVGEVTQPVAHSARWKIGQEKIPAVPWVTYTLECGTCFEQSDPCREFEEARNWAFAHSGRHPSHTAYRETAQRFWRATLVE